MSHLIVVALGGNMILKPGEPATFENQMKNINESMEIILRLLQDGNELVLTHGNGPQVGNILLQQEYAKEAVAPMPLDACGSMTQGLMGYMLQSTLRGKLQDLSINKEVVTLVTQVLVDPKDPAFENPTKPIGPFYKAEVEFADKLEKGYTFKKIGDLGYRMVVPSPIPKEIIERKVIKKLVDDGVIVITVGGGGIPVIKENGVIKGVSAVIDKDLASQVLANNINADELIILTAVSNAYLNYGKNDEQELGKITVTDAEKYLRDGHFGEGSMKPKILAGIRFIKNGGKRVIITDPEHVLDALHDKAGTRIIPE